MGNQASSDDKSYNASESKRVETQKTMSKSSPMVSKYSITSESSIRPVIVDRKSSTVSSVSSANFKGTDSSTSPTYRQKTASPRAVAPVATNKLISLDKMASRTSTVSSGVGKFVNGIVNSTQSKIPQYGGNFEESEIQVNIVSSMTGGDYQSQDSDNYTESSIIVKTIPIAHNMSGGAVDSEFDANKLLQAIMQSGGGDDSDDSDDDIDDTVEDTIVATPTTSSFEVKKFEKKSEKKFEKHDKKGNHMKKSKKDKKDKKEDDFDDSSSSSSSSDSDFSDSDSDDDGLMDMDSTPVDLKKLNKYFVKSNKSKYGRDVDSASESADINSDVYVMSDHDSINGITLKSFSNPLKSGSRKSKR